MSMYNEDNKSLSARINRLESEGFTGDSGGGGSSGGSGFTTDETDIQIYVDFDPSSFYYYAPNIFAPNIFVMDTLHDALRWAEDAVLKPGATIIISIPEGTHELSWGGTFDEDESDAMYTFYGKNIYLSSTSMGDRPIIAVEEIDDGGSWELFRLIQTRFEMNGFEIDPQGASYDYDSYLLKAEDSSHVVISSGTIYNTSGMSLNNNCTLRISYSYFYPKDSTNSINSRGLCESLFNNVSFSGDTGVYNYEGSTTIMQNGNSNGSSNYSDGQFYTYPSMNNMTDDGAYVTYNLATMYAFN